MATDSLDQLNLNPTTTTKENPKQTLDDDTTITAQPSVTVVDSDAKYGEDSKSSYGAKRGAIYTEIEIERGDEARGTKKET